MSDQDTVQPASIPIPETAIVRSFRDSEYLSIKYDSYFQAYEEILAKFVGKPITLVEIGVLNGGSLFAWRNYLGETARIIGIDLNPAAKRWERYGFEIYTGNQSDPAFWAHFFAKVGDIDVLLDDGGHTNRQQIVTVHHCIEHIRDGGVLITEDVHTSYFRDFGNPSRYSFINYAKRAVDQINSRFFGVAAGRSALRECVYYVSFFESIVCFHVDRARCFAPRWVGNGGISFEAEDFRHIADGNRVVAWLRATLLEESRGGIWMLPLRKRHKSILVFVDFLVARIDSRKLKRFFR